MGVFEPGAKEQHAVKDGPGISVPDTISRDHKPEEDRRAVPALAKVAPRWELNSISLGPNAHEYSGRSAARQAIGQ